MGAPFDLVYSIEVAEHIPLARHDDVAAFFAVAAAPVGAKLIFSAASPNQKGFGHIGGRTSESWKVILEKAGFTFCPKETAIAKGKVDRVNTNHQRNIMVFNTTRSTAPR